MKRGLRESGHLADDVAEGVGVVAEEAANVIGEFDEGFSNRQTWHNAALAAIVAASPIHERLAWQREVEAKGPSPR